MKTSEHLQNHLKKQREQINNWYSEKVEVLKEYNVNLPIFSSFDIRDNGNKVSIVDSNVFPSGFNNLDPDSRSYASQMFLKNLQSISQSKDILLILENHTRNKFYFKNIQVLSQILNRVGYTTSLGFLDAGEIIHKKHVSLGEGDILEVERIHRNGNSIYTKSFQDGIILLNNDFSVGKPKILGDISQLVIPPISLGWYNRKKSTHFQCYHSFINEIAELTSTDPWLLGTFFSHVDDVNFKDRSTLKETAEVVDSVIEKITQKYREYNVSEAPYVFVKNNSGTYGLGIITVSSGDEIINLNSKNRKKMTHGKEKSKINSVMVQEGITTKYSIENHPAEPVLYNVGENTVGGFMRFNLLQDNTDNLNKKGMDFQQLVDNELTRPIILKDGNFSLYSMLAMVASLAIAFEHLKEAKKNFN